MLADKVGKKVSGYPGDVGKALEILVTVHFRSSLTTVTPGMDALRKGSALQMLAT
jgi:hypothetical protein